MATAGDSLQWQELLEKEFDKAYVDIDGVLGDIDIDQAEITDEGRKRLSSLSSAFSQLTQKAINIFHNNAKLEAQLLGLQSELTEALAARASLQREAQHLLLQLHASQLQMKSDDGSARLSGEEIRKQLAADGERRRRQPELAAAASVRQRRLLRDSAGLRRYCLSVQAEVHGARLAAKYLDKELAGRVQQIQLLGRRMEGPEHDRLWSQLEAEIHLHRHKTVLRACRGRPLDQLPKSPTAATMATRGAGCLRRIVLRKAPGEGLGMCITGGWEHGSPILVSEIHDGQPASTSQQPLYVGDALLAVNGVSLRDARHAEAARLLGCQLGPEVVLHVVNVAGCDRGSDEEDDDEEEGEEEECRVVAGRMGDSASDCSYPRHDGEQSKAAQNQETQQQQQQQQAAVGQAGSQSEAGDGGGSQSESEAGASVNGGGVGGAVRSESPKDAAPIDAASTDLR